jgi:hypothetical protein
MRCFGLLHVIKWLCVVITCAVSIIAEDPKVLFFLVFPGVFEIFSIGLFVSSNEKFNL